MRDLLPAQGLYSPDFEHDACGVSFVVDIKGRASHAIVSQGINALCALQHRGASGCEVNTGDGAGILIQVPDRFLREVVDFDLPEAGSYAVGLAFLSAVVLEAEEAAAAIEKIIASEDLVALGWRDVVVDPSGIGASAKSMMPSFRQLFVADAAGGASGIALDRKAFMLRKRLEREVANVYFPNLSARTLVYKGMLTTPQLAEFFPELNDERIESALALVHSRFSTNTFPSWPLAHPYRYIAHNGEINTVQGNQNWMRAREALLASDLFLATSSGSSRSAPPGSSDTAL